MPRFRSDAPVAGTLSATLGLSQASPAFRLVSATLRLGVSRRLPLVVAALTLVVFSPGLWNGWVDWDDRVNFLDNHDYRGLGWTNLRWMVTTFLMGQWIPLTWLTLALDYTLWGMKPFGYHLTNVLLHAANAAIFCLVAARLLRLAMPAATGPAVSLGAAGAALFFALHPLRAESVAWVTERRDLLSGLFFLLTLLTYLAYRERQHPRRWLALSVVLYGLAVLSKSIVVVLPAILLLLDVYPLQRLRWHARKSRVTRAVLLEKIPYVALALVAAVMAVHAQRATNSLTSLDQLSVLDRIPVVFYSLWFYVSKTVLPVGLSPLHELPARIDPLELRFLLGALGVAGLTALGVALRRRWPAGLAAWVAYAIILAPVSGIVHNGHQLAHDRYSYLACLPWALLLGGVVCALLQAGAWRVLRPPVTRLALAAVTAWIVTLGVITWHQTQVWRDDDSLWRYALEADPSCAICHNNLGTSLYHRRLLPMAIERFERSIALRPDRARTHGGLGLALMAAGRTAEACPKFERVLAKHPAHNDTRTNLAVCLIQLKRYDDAMHHLHEVIRRDPQHALAYTNLGAALFDLGQPVEAVKHLERARHLKPYLREPHIGLVRTYVVLGRTDAAREELDALRAIDPDTAVHLSSVFLTEW